MTTYSVGDEVIYTALHFLGVVRRITKISTTGQITLDNGLRMTKRGIEIGGRRDYGSIEPATPEARTAIAAERQRRIDEKRRKQLQVELTNRIMGMGLAELEQLAATVLVAAATGLDVPQPYIVETKQ